MLEAIIWVKFAVIILSDDFTLFYIPICCFQCIRVQHFKITFLVLTEIFIWQSIHFIRKKLINPGNVDGSNLICNPFSKWTASLIFLKDCVERTRPWIRVKMKSDEECKRGHYSGSSPHPRRPPPPSLYHAGRASSNALGAPPPP